MIADFLKQLRQLPYQDMMLVAAELEKIIAERPEADWPQAVVLAEALAQLSRMPVEDSLSTQQENKILRVMFRAKRTIAIKEFNGGFNITLDTLRGHTMHKDLKVGINQMLDTLVAARALTGGK